MKGVIPSCYFNTHYLVVITGINIKPLIYVFFISFQRLLIILIVNIILGDFQVTACWLFAM